ncbi:MAG: aminoacetone oxidase family FAD-binding enzyme [Coriobacteriia bacterium]|nr:aminoacetone oxidase family FAD-binding enzyme [Coriobacteriia bacterium]
MKNQRQHKMMQALKIQAAVLFPEVNRVSVSSIAIVGGGASGLMAALLLAHTHSEITVYEASDKLGWTILRSGNGRCNFSNTKLGLENYTHPEFVSRVFKDKPEEEIQELFTRLGIQFIEEEGRLYPRSNSAQSVLQSMLNKLATSEVILKTNTRVSRIAKIDQRHGVKDIQSEGLPFTLFDERNEVLGQADILIWAAGGASLSEEARGMKLAHSATEPVLTALECESYLLKGLNGIRVEAMLKLTDRAYTPYFTEYGELLFRPYGVSGIAVFNLSRHLRPNSKLVCDFAWDMSIDELVDYLDALIKANPKLDFAHLLDGLLHPSLGRRIMELTQPQTPDILYDLEPKRKSAKRSVYPETGISVPEVDTREVAALVKNFELDVYGKTLEAQAQATRGGLELREVNPQSFELNQIPQFYVLGEALDVDAACGGFNLSWAWISALRAAQDIASKL